MSIMNRLKFAVPAAAFSLLFACSSYAQYTRTDLVTDTGTANQPADPSLVNGWGLVAPPTTPFWVSDNGTGRSTLYTGDGTKIQQLTVTIPPANGSGQGTPTGVVGNITGSNFVVSVTTTAGTKSGSALFIFSTFDGTISGWNPGVGGTNATIAVPATATDGAVYTGLAIANNGGNPLLYAADDGPNRKVDVYNNSFQNQKANLGPNAFVDPSVPKEFAPYGIQTVTDANGVETVWVTYTGLNKAQSGFVSGFTTTGVLKTSLHGPLHSPWGIALAPNDFPPFSNALLVSNNIPRGRIEAFDPNTGAYLGFLKDASGKAIEVDDIWAIQFGHGGGPNGATNQLFFTAGPDNYGHGIFGVIDDPQQ
jgi:uncharacterized protein (TIGR03118 family)